MRAEAAEHPQARPRGPRARAAQGRCAPLEREDHPRQHGDHAARPLALVGDGALHPQSTRFLRYQTRIKALNPSTINGMQVHAPKDLASPVNRLVMGVETRFPTAFTSLKQAAIRFVTR